MRATLKHLLTDKEKRAFKRDFILSLDVTDGLNTNISDLTVAHLSSLGMYLMKTEYGEKAPEAVSSIEALKILYKRSVEKGKSFFY